MRAQDARQPSTPTRQAFEHYHRRFLDRYHTKPEYGTDKATHTKHAGCMARLLRRHDLAELTRRIDAYFDSTDRFLSESGHPLGLFFSSDVQTKLIAQLSGVTVTPLVSDRTTRNIANQSEALRLIAEGKHGTHS